MIKTAVAQKLYPFGCHIDAAEQQRAQNFELVVSRYNELWILDNWNRLESFKYISLFFSRTSSVKQFVVTEQIFVYKCL